jgi:uncharacterized protein YcbX
MHLSELYVYPVKSLAGLKPASIDLDRFGPSGDRRWMVVSESGHFITQRELPRMALLGAVPENGALRLQEGGDSILAAIPDSDTRDWRVQVWGDSVRARDCGDDVAAWLSDKLERVCRLVYMPDDSVRRVDGVYASEGETVGFADGFPLLLISQASLDELNQRLPEPVPMNRFRPNLVVSGCPPFAEDEWQRIRIGSMEFDVAKPCTRCVIPSIIQETAERDPHINRALAAFRRFDGQVRFGQNLLYRGEGRLALGDPVEVVA